jgi:hypothetical protein
VAGETELAFASIRRSDRHTFLGSAVGPFVGPNAPICTWLQRVRARTQISRKAAYTAVKRPIRGLVGARFTRERALVRNQPRPSWFRLRSETATASWGHSSARRDEKALGRRRGPFHTGNDRKVREDADSTDTLKTAEKPCKSGRLRSNATRLKIVVSRFESAARHSGKAPQGRALSFPEVRVRWSQVA